ncbi:MAG: extracellular solute-binding protein [Actinobacteria bacterium]|nr:extracellular solute-binding protein [Actinomycetota bacterium]
MSKTLRRSSFGLYFLPVLLAMITGQSAAAAETSEPTRPEIVLKAFGVPSGTSANVNTLATLKALSAFRERFPHIKPVSTTGLTIPGRTGDVVPLMQIAGDIAPDVMRVNFRQSDTYIRNKFLYPLDKYIERTVGAEIENGHLLSLDDYLKRLEAAPRYEQELRDRVPRQCWLVMRRECPYAQKCPYLKKWGASPAKKHYHTWCFPEGPVIMALFYRKDLFAEAGLPDRVPRDWDEMLSWSRKLTNPREDRYGLKLELWELGWGTQSFLYSMGGRLVEQDEDGRWICTFDSEAAVQAYHFVARLFLEPFENAHGAFSSVVSTGQAGGGTLKYAMFFGEIDQRFFKAYDPNQYGFGPVPQSPIGKRGSEFNSAMAGIYAGLDDDEKKRDAAWEYIRFYDGPEARLIRTRVFVENGYGQYVQPPLLKAAGYDEYVRLIPKEWQEAYGQALKYGIPEPYGKNCQMVYRYASKAVNQLRTDDEVRRAIQAGNEIAAKKRIQKILSDQVKRTNEKMLGILSPEESRFRNRVTMVVAVAIFVSFVLVFRRVFRIFAQAIPRGPSERRHGWQFGRYKWAYIILLPALATVLLWHYYPLVKGMIIAFQDYNVRGLTEWVGLDNFSHVLFSEEFWFALWVSVKYALMFMVFGFCAPIILAFLLTEVPKGKLAFRAIYYLPAVLTGVVVIFLWKGFYGQYGVINQVLNLVIGLINHLPGVALAQVHIAWLDSPSFALFFCLLPTIWAGMGPGCLIYLAALKTIPEEIYEAADIDGAGIRHKVFHVAIPSIRALIMINFIGAMVGAIRSGGGFMLAMTGGGPYTPHGQTELVGLHIFWESFGYLRFGSGTAMAWVVGSMLIGFTVVQLQRLSKLEFRTVGGK